MRKAKLFADLFCPNRDCPDYGIQGKGNIVGFGSYPAKGGRRERFLCNTCGRTLTERTGTVFYGLHTPERTILLALAMLVECGSLRALSRIFEVKLDTVRLWLKRAAQHSELISERLIKDLHLSQIQVDELWSFVKKNTKIALDQ